jgi:hypothetical protein
VNLNVLHRRLLQDVLEIGNSLPLVITGGYAVQAHQLVDRLSRDIDVTIDSGIPIEDFAADIASGLTARGWDVCVIGVDPRSARMMATDPATGEQCELDILRESLQSALGCYAIWSSPRPLRRYRHKGSCSRGQGTTARSHRHPRCVAAVFAHRT